MKTPKSDRLACTFLALLCCLAAPSSLHAAPAWKAQDNSLPRQSGPGIVVCEPVTAPADSTDGDFGAGCALWLQMTVGGQPRLGKTPLWGALGRARTEMGRPDLQLSAVQAINLAPVLGVTHVAVGTLIGAGRHTVLIYRLLRVPLGAPVGAPIRLVGTRDQIVAGLPQVAQSLAKRLVIGADMAPTSTGLTPTDLQTLGRLRWQEDAPTDAQRAAVEAMATHAPLAGLMNLRWSAGRTVARSDAAARTLLAQAGGNPLVWGEIAGRNDLALLPHTARLSALATHYPGNYVLAVAETFRCRATGDHQAELQVVERAVRDAPHNPEGWLTRAASISRTADALRQGRFYSSLTPAEAAFLSRLYPQWEASAQRAAHLDPDYAKAWLRLAQAATFNSDAVLADTALHAALTLSTDKSDVYGWALEMYQPKWGGDAAKLARFARLASADTALDAGEAIYISKELRSSGSPDLQQKVLADFIARRRVSLASHPDDGKGRWDLALALEASGNKKEALAEYRAATTLLPGSADLRYDFGNALYVPDTYDQAVTQFQEAVRLDPDYALAHFYLGYSQKHLDHYEDAKRELRAALALDPALGAAYAALGDVFLLQNDFPAAVPNYQAAIRFGSYDEDNYDHLVGALAATGQYAQLLTTGEAALRNYRDGDAFIYDDMADACLHTKEWDRSVALSKAALAFDASDPFAHENLVEAYLGAGRVADAQAEWRKVITLQDAPTKAAAEGFLKKYP